MSQKRMTIAPIVKAQLPKINFQQAKKEQRIVDDLLLTQQHFHDSRDIVHNIINEKKKDMVNQSFQDQQISYQAIKQKLEPTKEIFNQRIVTKPTTRQARSNSRSRGQNSMIITIRDDSSFLWMNEFQKKNIKTNLPKPARNPVKIQENFSRLSNRKQMQSNEKQDETDTSFEFSGFNTNKTLKNYLTWDDPQTPQEIVNQFKNDTSYHAKCPFFQGNGYTWTEVQILDFDELQQKFIVKIIKNDQIKAVTRLSLMLKTENEVEFNFRLQQCKILQKQAEEELRFFKYVNNIPDNNVSSISNQTKNNIKKKIRQKSDQSIDFEQVEYEYKLFMKKFLTIQRMSQSEYFTDFITNRIKLRDIKDIQQKYPKIELVKKDFQQVKNQVAQSPVLNNKQILQTLVKIQSIKLQSFDLISTQYAYGQLPFPLQGLDSYNQQMFNVLKLSMFNNWRTQVIQEVQDSLRTQFNFYQTDELSYIKSSLCQILKRIDHQFTYLNMTNLAERNVNRWVEHIRSFTSESERLSKDSFIQINITVQQLIRKKTLLHKQSIVGEERYMVFEPTRQQIISTLTTPIFEIKNIIQQVLKVENDILPLLDIRQNLSVDIEQIQYLFDKAGDQIIMLIDGALKGPTIILEQFNEYSYLYTKSVSHLMKRLFGESKEKPAITYIELDKIKEKLSYYQQTIMSIERLCIDEKNYQFFQVRTSKVKLTLIQKSQEIINTILNRLSEILTDNISRIGKLYQDMCEKILQEPKDEQEMVLLKNFIAEAEVNLAKLANEVNLLFQSLDILHLYQFQYDTKEIESLWFLKQWPAEIRFALVQGQRNVQNKETRFTDKLDSEKELFIRDLLILETQVEEIKFYDDYQQVKVSASHVMGLKEKINNFSEKVRSFNDRESLFKQPLSDYDDLVKIKSEFEPFYKIWDLAIEFDVDKQEWYLGQFIKLQYNQIEKKMIQYYQKETVMLTKYFQDLSNDKALKVLFDLKKDLDKFKEVMWLIEFLNCEAILKKPKIWDEIYQICGFAGDDVTLIQLLEHNYIAFKSKIEDICRRATFSYDIEKRLNQVVDKCKEIKLDYVKNTSIIKIEDTQLQLDEQLNTVLLLKQSPYVVMEKAIVVEKKIILIQDTLENWKSTQRGYIYLQPIFQSDDLKKKLPVEKNNFDFIERFWKQLTDNFQKDPLVWENIENDRLKLDSKHCNDLLDSIFKGLNDYLEQKRKVFPRFFFLSDEVLFEILSQTKNPLLINNHISKCYEGILELQFDEQVENIENFVSLEKDIIPLNKVCNVVENDKKGNVEKWLNETGLIIQETVKKIMKNCEQDTEKQWHQKWPSQCIQTITQVKWTQSIEQALISQISLGNVLHQLKQQIKNLVSQLQQKTLTINQRIQINQIILLLVNDKSITEYLCKFESLKETDFEWLINLRTYSNEKFVSFSMLNYSIPYGYEFYSLTQRLVITPLTERCQHILIQAFQNNYGCLLQGPTGTGKTETIKDLAKCLGIQCILFNCGEGMNYLTTAKIFKGLLCNGTWCCLDEFNKINQNVLSVISQQIQIIQTSIKQKLKYIFFESDEYLLNKQCFINVTIKLEQNCIEIPYNLKQQFRVCAMMKPNLQLITEVYLQSLGFQQSNNLSQKIINVLQIAEDQLSSQIHYDFGIRTLKLILNKISQLEEDNEELRCLEALKIIYQGRIYQQDNQLFEDILEDVFPNLTIEKQQNQSQILENCQTLNLQTDQQFIQKCLDFEQQLKLRHGIIIIGDTMSGKSQLINVIAQHQYQINRINPKTLNLNQLYGNVDNNTRQFNDGVIPIIFRQQINQFIVFDGCIDNDWIENLYTILDENKKLCLSSGEIIKLYDDTHIIFETQNLIQASPSIISRCSVIYLQQLQWKIILDNENFNEQLQKKFIWLLDVILVYIQNKTIIHYSNIQLTKICINMMKTFNFKNEDQQINVFLFCILWIIGGICDENQKKILNNIIMKLITASNDVLQQYQINTQYPYEPQALHLRFMEPVNKPNLFDFYFDVNKNCWLYWNIENQLQQHQDLSTIFINCQETVKNQYWINKCLEFKINITLIGPSESGKTSQIKSIKQQFNNYASISILLNGQSQLNYIQNQIESKITQRRCKGHYGPEENKPVCAIFIDDINMNEQSTELFRQHIDMGGLFDLESKEFKYLEDSIYLCTTQKSINQRFMRHFMLLYNSQYSQESLQRIFNQINQWIVNQWSSQQIVNNAIQKTSMIIVNSTIQLLNSIQQHYIHTPKNCHYIFSIKDIQKIYTGIYMSDIRVIQRDRDFINLWQNECERVFGDRLLDKVKFYELLQNQILENIKKNYEFKELFYTNILSTKIEKEEIITYNNFEYDELKEFLNQKLDEFQKIIQNLNLVLFQYAIQHILRIIRGLQLGNLLLIGMTGSGKQSLSKFSTYLQFNKELNYYANDKDEMQLIIRQAGLEKQKTTIYINCSQLNDEQLDNICNLINKGELYNLFQQDDKIKLIEDLSENRINYEQFQLQVHQNLHLILTLTPIDKQFRHKIRQFPTFINQTSIDWFDEWPNESLIEISQFYLNQDDKQDPLNQIINIYETIKRESKLFIQTKQSQQYCFIYQPQLIEFIQKYQELYELKQNEATMLTKKYTHGVDKILQIESDVTLMKATLQELHPKLHKLTLENSHLLINLQKKQKEVDLKKQQYIKDEEECAIEKYKANQLKRECEEELNKVLPILAAATQALDKISNEDMNQLKSFQKPPQPVSIVMEALCYVFDEQVKWKQKDQQSQDKYQDFWEHAKKNLLNEKLVKRIREFKVDQIKNIQQNRIYKIKNLQLDDKVLNASKAAGNLSLWIRAVIETFEAYQIVDPKQQLLKNANSQLEITEKELKEKYDILQESLKLLNILQNDFDQARTEKEQLQNEVNKYQTQLERAEKLISGLLQEKENWRIRAKQNQTSQQFLQGDCLLSSAIITFFGPFPHNFREKILELLKSELVNIPFSNTYSLRNHMSTQVQIGSWNNQMKLVNDQQSIDNAIIIQNSKRWILIIDPYNQCVQWLKQQNEQLVVKGDIEQCIQNGIPILLSEPNEINIPQNQGTYAKLNNKKIELHPNFRLYILTRCPYYSFEICMQFNFINFQITQEGLEDLLLNSIMAIEEQQREEIRQRNIKDFYDNKSKQQLMEDTILKLLHETNGNLLEDETLVQSLQKLKNDTIEIEDKLKKAESDREIFNKLSSHFKQVSKKISQLYQVIQDLSHIQCIYIWPLEKFIQLFEQSIKLSKSIQGINQNEKNKYIYDQFTKIIYTYYCQSILEKDKLSFITLLLLKILQIDNHITIDEINFLLNQNTNYTLIQSPNQCPEYFNQNQWNQLNDFAFQFKNQNIVSKIQRNYDNFMNNQLDLGISPFQQLILTKILKPQEFINQLNSLILYYLDEHFCIIPQFNFSPSQTQPNQPILFIQSQGCDPTNYLQTAADNDKNKLIILSMGQGQDIKVQKLISKAIEDNYWILLQNCHLSRKFLMQFDELLENSLQSINKDSKFRLFLTSNPVAQLPIGFLMKCEKFTFENVSGFKNNLLRIYKNLDERQFNNKSQEYKSLLYSLAKFHSIVQERRNFHQVGWKECYDFTFIDFQFCEKQLLQYNIDGLKFLISEINYGGKIYNENDNQILKAIINQNIIEEEINEELTLQDYIKNINLLQNVDNVELFGLHINASIQQNLNQTNYLFDQINNRQLIGIQFIDQIDQVLTQISSIQLRQIQTDQIDYEYQNPLKTLIMQESKRLNSLIKIIQKDLTFIEQCVKGQETLNQSYERICEEIFLNQIPVSWKQFSFRTTSNLDGFIIKLQERINYFSKLIQQGLPEIFNISYFYYPQTLLTAFKLDFARQNSLAVESLYYKFTFSNSDVGYQIEGMQFQSAQWDENQQTITDPPINQFLSQVPIITVELINEEEQQENCLCIPVYDTQNGSKITDIPIQINENAEFWMLRGVAIFCSS